MDVRSTVQPSLIGLGNVAVHTADRPLGVTPTKVEASKFNFYYGAFQALREVSLAAPTHRITALIGPSGCGKSTLLRAINRMHDRTPGARGEGDLMLDGQPI